MCDLQRVGGIAPVQVEQKSRLSSPPRLAARITLMSEFDSSRYGAAFAALLSPDRLNLLDAGRPDKDYLPQLEALLEPAAFAPHAVRDENMATACRAAMYLYHDFLDESHALSQDLHTPEGSYWHGILHRREPDFDNAKYWFRKVGTHPIFGPLRDEAARLAAAK